MTRNPVGRSDEQPQCSGSSDNVSGNNSTALRHPNPGLALPPDAAAAGPFRFGVRYREIVAKGRDQGPHDRALNAFNIACPPECRDSGVAYQRSVGAVTQRQRAVPKQ